MESKDIIEYFDNLLKNVDCHYCNFQEQCDKLSRLAGNEPASLCSLISNPEDYK